MSEKLLTARERFLNKLVKLCEEEGVVLQEWDQYDGQGIYCGTEWGFNAADDESGYCWIIEINGELKEELRHKKKAASGLKKNVGAETLTQCVAERDGDCNHELCPQLKNRQPHCPLDKGTSRGEE